MEVVAPKVKRRLVAKTDVRTPEQKRIATIEKVYYDNETGYRNLKETWKAAKLLDKSITENDVKKWKASLEAQKKQVSGYNSFIPLKAYEEFQIDLLFFTKEGEPEPKAEVKKINAEAEEEEPDAVPKKVYIPGLIMVDTFSKYCLIVILPAGKTTGSVAAGLMEALNIMGCNKAGHHVPETIQRTSANIQSNARVVRRKGDTTLDDAGARASSGEDYQDYQGHQRRP